MLGAKRGLFTLRIHFNKLFCLCASLHTHDWFKHKGHKRKVKKINFNVFPISTGTQTKDYLFL